MTQFELNKKSCDELVRKYIELAYKNAKSFSIKDGALISKCFRVISKTEEDEKLNEKTAYEYLFKVLEISNTAGVFSFEDAAVIDVIIEFLKKETSENKEEAPVEL
jgi:hypothetical protein